MTQVINFFFPCTHQSRFSVFRHFNFKMKIRYNFTIITSLEWKVNTRLVAYRVTPQKRKEQNASQLLRTHPISQPVSAPRHVNRVGLLKHRWLSYFIFSCTIFFNENWKIKKFKINPYSFICCNLSEKGHKDRANEAFQNRLNHRV